MTKLPIADEPLPNPHQGNPDVHYRLYLDREGRPAVVCVQDFDYVDYDEVRFLTEDAYDSELAANVALNTLMVERMRADDFAPDEAKRLAASGIPLTRHQALDAVLA